MDIGSILITLALVVVAVAFIARPLVEGRGAVLTEEERRLSALRAELEKVLASLQEMDMDYSLQKIAAEDYQAGRAPLVIHGAELMKEIDQLSAPASASGRGQRLSPEEEIEAAVARLRGGSEAATVRYCGQCGQAIQEGDRFCARCGSPVQAEGGGA